MSRCWGACVLISGDDKGGCFDYDMQGRNQRCPRLASCSGVSVTSPIESLRLAS
jgi:hypothetical protein